MQHTWEAKMRHEQDIKELIFWVFFFFFQLLLKTMEYFSEVFGLRINEIGKHLSAYSKINNMRITYSFILWLCTLK